MASPTVRGTCNCGAITIAIPKSAFPDSSTICSCTNCSASCGSLYSVNLRLARKELTVEKGKTKTFKDKGDSGKEVLRHFCGDCGSPVFSWVEVDPEMAYVKGGLFRKSGVDIPKPAAQIYGKNRAGWEAPVMEGIQIVSGVTPGSA